MSDKRNAPRRDTFYYLTVSDALTGSSYGRVVDISERGLLLVTDRPGAIGESVHARVQVPPGSGADSDFACVLSRRWQRRDRNPELTLVGCEMLIGPEARTTVETLIQRYSFGGEIKPRAPDA